MIGCHLFKLIGRRLRAAARRHSKPDPKGPSFTVGDVDLLKVPTTLPQVSLVAATAMPRIRKFGEPK